MPKFKISESTIFNFQSAICNLQSLIARKAFTLLELLVVISIIVLLAGIMMPNIAKRLSRAKMAKAAADITNIETAISMYETDMGGYFGDLDGDITEVDSALTSNLTGGDKWYGPYSKGIPSDPWGQNYRFFDGSKKTDLANETDIAATDIPDLDYYIYSKGKDKDTGDLATTTKDDVNNWDVDKSWEDEY